MLAFFTTKVIIAIVVISAVSVTVIVLSVTLPVVLTRNSSSGSTTTGATTTTATSNYQTIQGIEFRDLTLLLLFKVTYQVDTSYAASGDPATNTINSVASLGDCETLCTNDNACYFVTYDSSTCSLFGSNSGLTASASPIQTAIKVVNGVPSVTPFVPG